MKKIYIIIALLMFANSSNAENKVNCESVLSKMKPECNFIGKSFKGLKNFSSKHQTIGQTMGKEKKEPGEKKTLRQISEENKTIDQTYRNIKKKLEKK